MGSVICRHTPGRSCSEGIHVPLVGPGAMLTALDTQPWEIIDDSTDPPTLVEYTAAETLWDLDHLQREAAANGMQITLLNQYAPPHSLPTILQVQAQSCGTCSIKVTRTAASVLLKG